jgi:serine/threonine protein kinase
VENKKRSGLIFLTDFGESVMMDPTIICNKYIIKRSRGTLPIQSPEILRLNESTTHTMSDSNEIPITSVSETTTMIDSNPDYRSDIWSLGCLLIELIQGFHLFEGKSWTEMFVSLCLEKNEYKIMQSFLPSLAEIDVNITAELNSLVSSIFRINPEKRCNLEQLSLSVSNCIKSINRMCPQSKENDDRHLIINHLENITCKDEVNESINLIKLNELVIFPTGLWNLGNNVWLELKTTANDIITDLDEWFTNSDPISNLLYPQIKQIQSFLNSKNIEGINQKLCEKRLLSENRTSYSYITDKSKEQLYYTLPIQESSGDDKIDSAYLVSLHKKAIEKFNQGYPIIISLGCLSQESHQLESMNVDNNSSQCISTRRLLSLAIALALNLVDHTNIFSVPSRDNQGLSTLYSMIPWINGKCSEDNIINS